MFRKLILVLLLASTSLFSMSASMVQRVEKEELGCIKGIGIKRVQLIVEFRKNNTISSLDELLEIKGIGKGIIKNIRDDIQKKVCTKFTKSGSKKKQNIKAISAE